MCGIFGYLNKYNSSLSSEIVYSMGASLNHRGPDDSGIYFGNDFALGNQRLAIIDIEQGHQPFISTNEDVIVVQNGEIFNYLELAEELNLAGIYCLTQSDTEVILRLYEYYGIDFISKLNGMFAIAIYDRKIDALYLIRDRVGEKPLYFFEDEQSLIFASEIKSILETGIEKTINYEALNHFFSFNFVPLPYTIFANIKHVEPGHYLKITRDNTAIIQWWDLSLQKTESRTENEWMSSLDYLLKDATRLRLRADVPLGAFLSGGVDSSTIVGYMTELLETKFNTYCIGFHDIEYDESEYAAEAAQRFNTNHSMLKVDSEIVNTWPQAIYHCDQPHGDLSFLPTMELAKMAGKDVKIVLTGDGADELFAGYDKYKNFFNRNDIHEINSNKFQEEYYQNICLFSDTEKSKLFSPQLKSQITELSSYSEISKLFAHVKHMDRINQVLYIDMMQLLPGNNLVKPDRMAMAASVETRAPFLDYRLIEFSFKIPGDLKLNNNETKYIYKKTVTNLIGDNLAYRKKCMFTVPIGNWLKEELYEFCIDLLISPRAKARTLFDYDYIKNMINQHREGLNNFTREIRALIAVELWFREFIDES